MVESLVFRLDANVNGSRFTFNGTGPGNSATGECTLNLEASPAFPVGFDPTSCPMVCSHPTSLYFAREEEGVTSIREVSGANYRVSPARQGMVYDSKGNLLMHLSVTGTVREENGVLISEHQMEGFSNLPTLASNVTPVDDYILPTGPGLATALTRWQMLTVEGDVLQGITTVPYAWDNGAELPSAIRRSVEEITVDWDGNQVSAYYRTALRPASVKQTV